MCDALLKAKADPNIKDAVSGCKTYQSWLGYAAFLCLRVCGDEQECGIWPIKTNVVGHEEGMG